LPAVGWYTFTGLRTSVEYLKVLRRIGVEGAIIGKALYTGDIDLKQALDVANQ